MKNNIKIFIAVALLLFICSCILACNENNIIVNIGNNINGDSQLSADGVPEVENNGGQVSGDQNKTDASTPDKNESNDNTEETTKNNISNGGILDDPGWGKLETGTPVN